MHFNDQEFLSDDGIQVTHGKISKRELNEIFVQAAVKDAEYNDAGIEIREVDPKSYLVTAKEARKNPAKWRMELGQRVIPPLHSVRPVPVAIDKATGKTLILDSNHLMVNMPESWSDIPAIFISGPHLENIIRDFRILNR